VEAQSVRVGGSYTLASRCRWFVALKLRRREYKHARAHTEVRKTFDLQLDPFWPESGSNVFLWRGKRQVVPFGKDPDVSQFNVNFTPEERKVGFGGLEDKYLKPLQERMRALPDDTWPVPQMAELGDISLGDYLHKQGASADAIQALSLGFERDSLLDFVHDSLSHVVPKLWKIRGGTINCRSHWRRW